MTPATTPRRVVAIDGAAGSGKSTLARGLAEVLGLPYVNTGIMYRALTLAAIEGAIDTDDGDALAQLMSRLTFGLSSRALRELEVEGLPPSEALQGARVEAEVSRVARHPQVRTLMRDAQRVLGSPDAVVEGRDIGTVVFPDARVKLFLQAAPDTRVERRAEQRGSASDEPGVAEALHRRDAKDATVNPFEPAPGAIIVDTSDRTVEDTLRAALEIVREHMPGAFA
ncbi:MAG: (d)CMP kinase [Actinomycetota bacterium]